MTIDIRKSDLFKETQGDGNHSCHKDRSNFQVCKISGEVSRTEGEERAGLRKEGRVGPAVFFLQPGDDRHFAVMNSTLNQND